MVRLEKLLGLPRNYLRRLASQANLEYSPFPKPDRARPFPKLWTPHKARTIDNPSDQLKSVQSRIDKRLLKPLALPRYIMGGIKGKSPIDNARLHQDSPVLAKLDIRSFFPSITSAHVYVVWRNLLGCSDRIAKLLTKLTTFDAHLPQGAPTSTSIANLVLHSVDGPIRAACRRKGIEYSSWIDDLAFSSDDPRSIIPIVISVLRKSGFRVARSKLQVTGPGKTKILSGLIIDRRIGIPRGRLSRIRSGISKLRQGHVTPQSVDHYV